MTKRERAIEVFSVSSITTHLGWKLQFSETAHLFGIDGKEELHREEALGMYQRTVG